MQYLDVRGTAVPALGLGTWELTGEDCRRAVREALEIGYRHIDTAQIYGNEADVGAGLRAGPVPREELFLTTKIWNSNHGPRDVRRSTDGSLRALGTEYVDLMLIHWPVELDRLPATLDALGELRDEGKIRHLGVSNFTPTQLELAREHADIVCDQVEFHPYLGQDRLLEVARAHDVVVTAYSPLARGKLLRDEVVADIAATHGVGPAQVVLRWLLDHPGVAVVPKATSREHLQANADLFSFSLTDDDRARIDALERGERIIDPPFAPDWER